MTTDSPGRLASPPQSTRSTEPESTGPTLEDAGRTDSHSIAVLSHELRTPMVGIVAASELLAETELDPAQRRLVATVKSSAAWLVEVLNSILEDSKNAHRGPGRLPSVVAVRSVMRDLREQFADLARARSLQWSMVTDRDVAACHAVDATKLRRVLANLVSNALKVTREGHIRVSCSVAGAGRLRFEVEDTGPGVDPGTADTLFEAYCTGAADQGDSPSTGLGLPICRHLVQRMNGTIGVRSTAGGGATFYFEVEAIPAAGSETAVETTREQVPARILLVDDHAINLAVLGQMLEHLGHTVDRASDGAEAIQLGVSRDFDLILMDVELPRIGGLEACRRIRAARGPGPRIVGLSADGGPELRSLCERAEMNGFVLKPVRLPELAELVAQHAASPRSAPR